MLAAKLLCEVLVQIISSCFVRNNQAAAQAMKGDEESKEKPIGSAGDWTVPLIYLPLDRCLGDIRKDVHYLEISGLPSDAEASLHVAVIASRSVTPATCNATLVFTLTFFQLGSLGQLGSDVAYQRSWQTSRMQSMRSW